MSEQGYRVVPASLRNAQKAFAITGDEWDALRKDMAGWTLGDTDLGLLGRLAGVVSDYNGAVTTITDKLQTGAQSLHAAGTALDSVAAAYEKQDETYYAKFGWTEQQMDGVAPPPD
ncbi:MAG: hypothetical protein ACJ72N_09895 [Labedaea sp.]